MTLRPLRVLYVGTPDGTCLQRAEALRSLGHRLSCVVSCVPPVSDWRHRPHRLLHRLHRFPDLMGGNRALRRTAAQGGFDLVWIDKGLQLSPRTLDFVRARQPGARLVSFSPDDMLNPANQSPRYLAGIPLYDLHVTTKSYNVAELRELGARDACFMQNAFDPVIHRPFELMPEERARFGAPVGFIGMIEGDRERQIRVLLEAGISVSVHGPGWQAARGSHPLLRVGEEWLDGERYSRAICAIQVNLGFLRKGNRDLQTTRSVEIPACGGFLLAERTDEHLGLFREGVEAEFFSSPGELLAKCRHYLADPAARQRIAAAGRRRCLESDYSYPGRLCVVLEYLARDGSWPTRGAS